MKKRDKNAKGTAKASADRCPRRVERFHPEWTDVEMDAISKLAKAKQMPRKNIIRQALRLYQSVALGACVVVWPRTKRNSGVCKPAEGRAE